MTKLLDRDLSAMSRWLPVSKWSFDTIINQHEVDGMYCCKVCDGWVSRADVDKHVNTHVNQEKARAARVKEEAREEREAQKEWLRAEKESLGDIKPRTPRKETNLSDSTNSTNTQKVKADSTEVSQKVEAALSTGQLSLAQLSETTGLKVEVIRPVAKALLTAGTIKIVGKVETGKRGRPAAIYGVA